MKQYIYNVIIVLFVLLNYCCNNIFVNAITESDCIQNLVSIYGIAHTINSDGEFSICETNSIVNTCDSNGSINERLSITNPDPSNIIPLTKSHIECFPNAIIVTLYSFTIDSDILYSKIGKIRSFDISGSSFTSTSITSYLETDSISLSGCTSFDKSTLDLKYLKNVSVLSITGSRFILLNSDPQENTITSSFYLEMMNIPDLSLFKSLTGVTVGFTLEFDSSTIHNLSTFNASSSIQLVSAGLPIPLSVFTISNYYTPYLNIYGKAEQPTSIIDMTQYTNIKTIRIQSSPTLNYNGLFPFKVNSNVYVVIDISGIVNVQPLTQFSPLNGITISNSLTSDLGSYQGDFKYLDLSRNFITGNGIDSSWCSTNLVVTNNKLTGTIPSCFKCYFEDLTTDKNYPNLPIMKNRFIGNTFTNIDTSEPCTTFKPKLQVIDSSTLLITGTDIGFKPYNIFIEDTECSYTINELGKSYTCGNLNGLFDSKDYYSVRFLHPGNRTFTFPTSLNTPPTITSVIFSGSITINGQFFSSYPGYVSQSVKVQDYECEVVDSGSDFFKITCNLSTFTEAEKIPIELTVNSLANKVVVSQSLPNNKQCLYNCRTINLGVCDLSTGLCLCQVNGIYQDCDTHTISSIDASNENGGEATFYGNFTDEHNELSITIGDQPCTPITLNTSTIIKCIAQPGKGVKTVVMIQNDLKLISTNTYKYKELSIQCPNNCTNNNQGICDSTTGICNCINGYQTYDCSIKEIENNNGGNNNGGGGNSTVIDPDTGSTNVTNGETRFQIYFNVLNEVDIQGNIINSYSLKDHWTVNTKESIYTFKQQLNNTNCIVTSTIEEITNENGKSFTFADTTFNLSKNSIKFTISIENYSYQSTLNTLSLEFISTVDQLTSESNCNSKDIEIDTSNVNDISSFNYIKISKNNQVLTGRFINKLLSDSRPTFYSTTVKNNTSTSTLTSNSSIILSLNLPHCKECIIDPDFSIIITNSFKSDCNSSSSSRKWLIPVAVVVPVVGLACIIIIASILYKKNTSIKVLIKDIKLNKLNK